MNFFLEFSSEPFKNVYWPLIGSCLPNKTLKGLQVKPTGSFVTLCLHASTGCVAFLNQLRDKFCVEDCMTTNKDDTSHNLPLCSLSAVTKRMCYICLKTLGRGLSKLLTRFWQICVDFLLRVSQLLT